MATDDVDWDDVVVPGRAAAAPAEPAPAEGVLAVAPARAHGPSSAPLVKWTIRIPAPKRRTRHEQFLAAARMREHRAKQLHLKKSNRVADTLNSALDKLRASGRLLDHQICVSMKGGALSLEGVAGCRRRRLSYDLACGIAFNTITRRNDLSQIYKISPKSVARLRNVVAHVTWRSDRTILRSIADSFRHTPPLIFVSGVYADSTKEALNIPVQTMLPTFSLHAATKSSWNVLVSSQRFAWCSSRPDAGHTWYQADFTRPNVPIATDAAECLMDGLYCLKAVEHFSDLELAGAQAATITIAHFDLDGHAANARLVAGRRATLLAQVDPDSGRSLLTSVRHCGNHANNLVEGCVVQCIGPAVFAWLYMTSTFLSMGGNFLRLIHATPKLVSKHLRVVRGPPLDAASPERLAAAEARDYSTMNFKAFCDTTQTDEPWTSDDDDDDRHDGKGNQSKGRKPRHAAYHKAWDRFLEFWNGEVWHDGPMVHFCADESCCQGFDKGVCERRAVDSIVGLLWRSQPVLPTKGKWTTLGAALDWHMTASGLASTFAKVFPLAFQRLTLRGEIVEDDAAFLIDADWHALQGKNMGISGEQGLGL